MQCESKGGPDANRYPAAHDHTAYKNHIHGPGLTCWRRSVSPKFGAEGVAIYVQYKRVLNFFDVVRDSR